MNLKETILKNKATIIGCPLKDAKTVTIIFGFKVGARLEDTNNEGVSHFLEHMLFKGSEKRPEQEIISGEADSMGAYLNGGTGKEYTYFIIQTIKENFEKALDLVGDFVTRPTLKENEFQKEKGTIIQELGRVKDDPESYIFYLLENNLFKGTKMGTEVLGTEKSIKNLSYKDLATYYQKHYTGQNLTVLIAGDVPDNYLEQVTVYASRLPKGENTKWEKISFATGKTSGIYRNINQVQIGLALPAYPINDTKKEIVDVIATAFGGSTSSRLFREIREKRALAYSIGAFNDFNSDSGFFGIYGGLNPEKVAEALEVTQEEFLKFPKTVSDEEIERAKNYLKGSAQIQFERTSRLAMNILIKKIIGNTLEMPEESLKRIEKVTKLDVERVSEELFQKKVYLSTIGPLRNTAKFDKILNR